MADSNHLPHGTRSLFQRRVDPPPPTSTLYAHRRPGTYPQSAGIPSPFVATWHERFNPELDADPHLYIAEDVWETHFRPGTRFAGYLVNTALVHPALMPCFWGHLPFLRPVNFLSGTDGEGILNLLDQASASREALNVLLSSDNVTTAYVRKFRTDLPPYLFEGQLKCDSCTELGKTYNCPCIFVNLGRLTEQRGYEDLTAYALKCFSCAELKRRCLFSFRYGETVKRGVELHARVVRDVHDLTLGEVVWWRGQTVGVDVRPLDEETPLAQTSSGGESGETHAEGSSEGQAHNGPHETATEEA